MSAIVTGMCYCICVACVSTVRHSIKRKETITERDLANAALSVAIASIRLSCGMLVVMHAVGSMSPRPLQSLPSRSMTTILTRSKHSASISVLFTGHSFIAIPVSTHRTPPRIPFTRAFSLGDLAQNRRLSQLEAAANRAPNDADKQAAFLTELIDSGNHQLVIQRVEKGPFARNERVKSAYVDALTATNQLYKLDSRSNSSSTHNQSGAHGAAATIRHAGEGISASHSSASVIDSSGKRENPIHVIVQGSRANAAWRVFKGVGAIAFYSFVILTVVGYYSESTGLLRESTTEVEYEPTITETVKFSDVHGVDEAKQELEDIVEFLRDPTKFTVLGGKLPKGVLLTGPPGTGKTMLARAVAGEAGVPFFFMSGSEFDEMYVGVGARRVRELFAAARRKAPSIVFIDELDAIGSKRNPKDQSYVRQTLNQLLVDLDGFSQTEGVIFIAATNFPESLDKALLRPGRFDRLVSVPLPDVRGRMQILSHHMKGINYASNVDLSIVARGTPGFSGADLKNLANLAALQAAKDLSPNVNLRHLEHAKDKILMGAERKSAVITDESKRLTAYHEGGHALVAWYTPGAMPLHKVTCIPRGNSLGMTIQLPDIDKDSFTMKEYLAQIDVCMGGRVAEEMIFGKENITSGAHNDIMKATDVAKRMVTQFGMSDKVGPVAHFEDDMPQLSAQTKVVIEGEIKSMVESAQARANQVLNEHKEELHRLAKALIDHETLDQEQVAAIIRGVASSADIARSAPLTDTVEAKETKVPSKAKKGGGLRTTPLTEPS